MKYNVSIVLTLHNEGRIAYRSFQGVRRAMSYAQERGITVELAVVMDSVTDDLLKRIVHESRAIIKEHVFIYPADFGSLSLSRNFGIEKSQGEIIAILDGDDLFCENWIYKVFKTCSENPGLIAHPEATYYFPYERFVRFSNGSPTAIVNLIIYNQWTALTAAHRDIFNSCKYVQDVPPYAFQDWLWNCETVFKGYHHVIVPETVLAVRQKPVGKSLWQNTHSQNKVVRPNMHFRNIFLRQYGILKEAVQSDARNGLSIRVWDKARRGLVDYLYKNYPSLFPMLLHLRRIGLERIRATDKANRIPPWLSSALTKLSRIEPSINESRNIDIRRPDKTNRIIHAIATEMSELVGTKKAKVYILDNLERNHIHLNALNFISAQEKAFLITTEKTIHSPVKPPGVKVVHIPIGNSRLFFEERLQLLHRLLLESDTEYIHIINSRMGYKLLDRYKRTFNGRKIFSTLVEPSYGDADFGWELKEYSELFDSFSNISIDADLYKSRIQNVYGIFRSEMTTIHFPYAPEIYSRFYSLKPAAREKARAHSEGSDKRRILIAGPSACQKSAGSFVAPLLKQLSGSTRNRADIWEFKNGSIGPSKFSVFDSDCCILFDYFPGMVPFCIQILGLGIPLLVKEGIILPECISYSSCFGFDGSAEQAADLINRLDAENSSINKGKPIRTVIRQRFGKEIIFRRISEFYDARPGFDALL